MGTASVAVALGMDPNSLYFRKTIHRWLQRKEKDRKN